VGSIRHLFRPGRAGLLYSIDHAAYLASVSSREALQSSSVMSRVLVSSANQYQQDLVLVHSDAFVEIQAAGGKLAFAEIGPPTLRTRPKLNSLKALDPYRDGRLPLMLEAADMVRNQLPADQVVVVSVKGPFTFAAALVGESDFLANVTKPGSREWELLDLARESSRRMMRAVREIGAFPMLAEPLASLVSVEVFLEMVEPSIRFLTGGEETIVHMCGNTDHLFPVLAPMSGIFHSLEITDILKALTFLSSSAFLIGGMGSAFVRHSSEAAIRESARRILESTPVDRFLLCSGCDLVWDSPVSKGRALVEAARNVQ